MPVSMLPVQHDKRCKWKIWALVCLLTCRVIPQVQVVPCSKSPDLRQGTQSCGWQVSSEGRCRTSRGSITHGTLHPTRYCIVNIRGNSFQVHRLVALAFLGLPPSDTAIEVNHLDGNCSNNRVQNLEWATRSQNARHIYMNLSRSKRCAVSRPVLIRSSGSNKWTRFLSVKLAAEAVGQSSSTVRDRCRKLAQTGGYEYQFAPIQEVLGEEWQPMKDPTSGILVPGRVVSSHGRITQANGGISTGRLRPDGYRKSMIKVGLSWRDTAIHRLVAASFLGQPPSAQHSQINHKDGNKSNNAVENLEYVTPAENIAHRCANLKGPHPKCKAVLSRAYGTNQEWTYHPSMTHAAKTLGLHHQSISACARGVQKQTGGYELRVADPEPHVVETLPGEVWLDVDLDAHFRDRERRRNRLSSHG